MKGTFGLRLASVAGVALVLVFAACVSAVQLSFQAVGMIDEVSGPVDDKLQALVGNDLFVEYQFDSLTQDSDPDPNRGAYFDPLGTVRVTAGRNVYVADGVSLVVEETAAGDFFSLSQIVSGNLFANASQAAIGLTFVDSSGQALQGDRLPSSPSLPSDFDQVGLSLGFGPVDDDDFINDDFDLIYAPARIGPPADDDDPIFDFLVNDDLDINDDIDPVFRRFDTNALRTTGVRAVPEPSTVVSALGVVAFVFVMVVRSRLMPKP